MQRAFLLLALLAAGAASQLSCGGERDAATTPERVILIVVDTLRRDHVSAYGGDIPTPHMDRIAERGQRIDGAVSSFHMTSMSMAALFTGRTPSLDVAGSRSSLRWTSSHWCGLARFASSANSACIPDSVPVLGERMREAGYWTIGIASNAMLHGRSGFSRGFDDWRELGPIGPPGQRRGRKVLMRKSRERAAGPVLAAAREALDMRESDRFFLYLHLMDAHDFGSFNEGHAALAFAAQYRDGVVRSDEAVGEFLAHLDSEGLLDGSVVILTADHGERLGELHPLPTEFSHGGNPSYEYLVEVPLLVAPAVLPSTNALFRGQDLYGAILELVGLESSDASTSENELDADELYLSERRWQTYRKGRFKLMRSRAGNGLGLYDLESDPAESINVAAEHPDVVAEYRNRIHAIATRLAARRNAVKAPSEEDLSRLRVLGYVE